MNPQDHVGPGHVEVLVAAFERGAAEIGRRQPGLLQHGAHGPVEDENALVQGFEERPLPADGLWIHKPILVAIYSSYN